MKKLQSATLAVMLSVTALFALTAVAVSAATNSVGNKGNGMRVSPVRNDLVIQPGSSKIISVYVKNITGGPATYKVVTNDFIASEDETGAPSLLLNGETNDKHGLKKYMTTIDTISVPKGEQKEIKVSVTMPKGIAGGGYYGAIRFEPIGSKNDANLSLSGSVASLLLVRVPGDVVEKLSLVSLDARKDGDPRTVFTSNSGIQAAVRFRNQGNIQQQPFGKILLKKGNKVVGTYEVNKSDQPGNVLPDSIRRFNVDLKNVGSFGKYTIEGNFGYGSAGQLLSAKTTFYVIPLWMILTGLAIIALILFLIFGAPKLIRRYNKSVVRKAGRH